ncbi:hypothetical protein JCM14076_27110 [Methylosoma difficile]
MDKAKAPLKVALFGMDSRSQKMMMMFLQGPCKGIAVVAGEQDAVVDIYDADVFNGQKLLDERLAKNIEKPLIVLSLTDRKLQNVYYVKKPIKTDEMIAVLNQVKSRVGDVAVQRPVSSSPQSETIQSNEEFLAESERNMLRTGKASAELSKPVLKNYVINNDEQNKTSKHQAAMQLNEKSFSAFIGNVPGIDVNDPKQFAKASYNPKEYYQGYVESAFKVSESKGQARQLNSGWNPLLIFPQGSEVWLDADENQLRSFSGLAINNTLGAKMSITPLSQEAAEQSRALERFHSMEGFLWKVACWASKGRYPLGIDIDTPVYLKRWPNFTRVLVTPHAMRIAALLIQGPRRLDNVAKVLNIKPQYVFIFISAACALGIAGQVKREADVLLELPPISPNKNQGLLSRILSKLRGK